MDHVKDKSIKKKRRMGIKNAVLKVKLFFWKVNIVNKTKTAIEILLKA